MLNPIFAKTFLTLVDNGSFRATAEELQVAQPTVSQHIKRLEDRLGVALIRRSHARCAPTRHGRLLLPHARALVAAAERAAGALHKESLRIGASGTIGTYILPRLIKSFARRKALAPTLSIELAPNPEVAERILSGALDVALLEWWEPRPGFQASIWSHEELVVALPPDHAFAKRRSLSAPQAAELTWIGGEAGAGTRSQLGSLLGVSAEEAPPLMAFGSTEAAKRAVRAGLGAALVMAAAVEDEVNAGQLVALDIEGQPTRRPLYVVLPDAMPPHSAAVAFAESLQRARSQGEP